MRTIHLAAVVVLLAAPAISAEQSRTYVGVVTDTMCNTDHKPMKVSPDPECVRQCVRHGSKYALVDGGHVYTLSDQQTPVQFAGTRVRVTGVLYPRTNVLKVDRIERAE